MKEDKLNPPPYRDLIGDMLNNDANKGKIDHLQGAGKPLSQEYLSGDTFQHFQRIAKDAGYKPLWLTLQHEIRDELTEMIKCQSTLNISKLTSRLLIVNEKIRKYNKSCPPPLQKGMVSIENFSDSVQYWK